MKDAQATYAECIDSAGLILSSTAAACVALVAWPPAMWACGAFWIGIMMLEFARCGRNLDRAIANARQDYLTCMFDNCGILIID